MQEVRLTITRGRESISSTFPDFYSAYTVVGEYLGEGIGQARITLSVGDLILYDEGCAGYGG